LSTIIRFRVPGSSANIGPGFDALAIALNVYLECRFSVTNKLAIRASGRDAHLISTKDDNLIWQTALTTAARANRSLPAVDLEIINHIPLGKGLGSSAAALISGVIMAERLLDLRWSPHRILDEAARIEGHPDNVAACVLGSVVASAVDPGGIARAVRIAMPPRIAIAVVAPDYAVPTKVARSVLPEYYSMADAVWNIQRASLLVAALSSGDLSAFPTALDDRMHQPYRLQLVPGLSEILRIRTPGLLGCAMSGAGPAVLVFYEKGCSHVVELVRQAFAMNGSTTEIVATGISEDGFEFLGPA
jgi:homoserine kinase